MNKEYIEFARLVEVVKKLRDPDGGCPWDLKQTHNSLLKYLIEESYEFIHATESEDIEEMEEEIGDVLLQVLLHAQLASEKDNFNIESVSKKLADKLIYRHPHVFKEKNENISEEEVVAKWDDLKKSEKEGKDQSLIDNSYINFPALFSANKIGKKTNKINFDWDDATQVAYKVEEEWQELKEEIGPNAGQINIERVEEELGDFLFSAAQLGRHLGIDPEDCLLYTSPSPRDV